VINPRATDDTPVDRNGAGWGRKFVSAENFIVLLQVLTLKTSQPTFASLKGR
jgi:hypothetical protein